LDELAVLVLFAAVSSWLIALNLWDAGQHHLVWTGIDGEYPIDQLQYLAWISDAAHHVLVSDLFVSHGTPHDYLQPLIAISGALTAAGLAPWLSLLIWKPVAVLALFLAVREYCRRLLPARAGRLAALLLALFAASLHVLEDEWIPFQAWGYPFDLLALAALIGALLAYDRSRATGSAGWAAPGLGALAAWLHPWQGELLILVVIGAEVVAGVGVRSPGSAASAPPHRPPRRVGLLAGTVAMTALPLIYYACLGHFDPAWRAGQLVSQQSWPLSRVALPLAPLLIVALPAYGRPAAGLLDASVRVWPLAALAVWAINQTQFGAWSVYAWVGITVPLAVLAVQGAELWLGRIPHHRWLAALGVLALILPGSWAMIRTAAGRIEPHRADQNLISRSESRALAYLAANPRPGGVLSPFPTGDAVPGETGRRTVVGDNRWTERFDAHNRQAWSLVHGRLSRRQAVAFLRSTDTRFILAPCGSRHLRQTLGPMLRSVRQFGCFGVYELS
jgi:hypothetical protein